MKNQRFTHINKTERLEIAALLGRRRSIGFIAEALGRSKSSVSDEIKKNSVNGEYDPQKAHNKSRVRRQKSKYQGMKVRSLDRLERYIVEKLKLDWSPELIVGRIKYWDNHIPYGSFRAVYKYIDSVYGQHLQKHLVRKYKKKKPSAKKAKEKIKDRSFIENRPGITEKRGRFGDWEGDLIVSGKSGHGVLIVLHERKSRYVLIRKVLSQSTEVINQAIYELTGGLVQLASLTLDNDISFAKHEELSDMIGVPIFFCHPYHSWEKGGVENTNGLIRRYIPKGADISQYSDIEIAGIQNLLNNRPRKCLRFKTPQEVMAENNQLKQGLDAMLVRDKIKQAGCSA